MRDALDQNLAQAYDLIEQNKLAEARSLLQPLLETHENSPDVWWLYSHAVEDEHAARRALNRVIELDPEYPDAAGLLAELGEPSSGPIKQLSPISRSATQSTQDDMDFDDDEDFDESDFDLGDEDDEEEGEGERSNPLRLLAIVAVFVVVAIIALILASSTGGQPTATETVLSATDTSAAETPVAAQNATSPTQSSTESIVATEESTPTEEVMETGSDTATVENIPTEEAVDVSTETPAGEVQGLAPFSRLYDQLATFTIPADGIGIRDTSQGSALVVEACSPSGSQANTTLASIMDIVASEAAVLDASVQFVAVQIGTCEEGDTGRLVGVPTEDALAYSAGQLDERAFQQRWQPID